MCSGKDDKLLKLKKDTPLVIIVHGCFSSAGRFKALSDVFAFHGQQTVCFNYNDRDSLEDSSEELIDALKSIDENLNTPKITIVGHSQGGLISRRALIQERENVYFRNSPNKIALTTISTPFNGIKASSHCGSKTLARLSLGLTKPLCKLITGAKYKEIPPNSEFIRSPGELTNLVETHIRIATNEENTCRTYKDGKCVKDDYVFSVEEQIQEKVEKSRQLDPVLVNAGHAEIVGSFSIIPHKLIAVLQREGVMNSTGELRQSELTELLEHLYLAKR